MCLWLKVAILLTVINSLQRDRAEEKRDRVIAAVVDATEQLCQCGFTAGYIDRTVSGFQCSSKQTSQVVFRSKLYGTADTTASIVTTHINRWISDEVSVVILGLIVAIDPLCPIHISSFSDPECQVATSPLPVATTITPNTMNSTSVPHIRSYTETIIAGVIVGIVILAIAAAVVVIAVLIKRRSTSWILRDLNERYNWYRKVLVRMYLILSFSLT